MRKPVFGGLPPGKTPTGLLSYRDKLGLFQMKNMRVFEGKALYVCGVGGGGCFSIQWVVVFCENVIL